MSETARLAARAASEASDSELTDVLHLYHIRLESAQAAFKRALVDADIDRAIVARARARTIGEAIDAVLREQDARAIARETKGLDRQPQLF